MSDPQKLVALGRRLRELREEKGLSQGALAERAGFGDKYISEIELGTSNPSLMTMVLYLYNAAFKQFNFSYAAAIGIILFAVIFSATLVQRRLFGQAPSW